MYIPGANIDPRFIYYTLAGASLLMVMFLVSKKVVKLKGPFIIITIACNIIYLIWRAVYTLPFRDGVLSAILGSLLLLAEIMGFFQSAVFRMMFIKAHQPLLHRLNEWREVQTVDVFIATYNESMLILRKTIIACKNLDYPTDRLNIYLCDDGEREEAHALCEELGIKYLAREEHMHAKAGNINYALQHSSGNFVLLLDADMIPKSDFLQKTMGYFVDNRVGFVQTPQIFYNPDPFQFNLHLNQKIPNEQDLFMLDIQEARASFNAVLHVGTNAVFRRNAIDEIGGIPTGTITEDMATGMLLQAKGYRSVFIREVLCTGLSVESFSDLIHQRERWCRGNIQVVKKWNPLTIKGLSLAQRIIYVDGLIYWFFGVQKVIYLLCPLIYLIFGTVILKAPFQELLLFWFPSYFGSFLAYRILVHKGRSLIWSHIYEVAMAPYLAMAALVEAIFSRPIPFRVTPKGENAEQTTFAFQTAIPYILLLAMTILGGVITLGKLSGGIENLESVIINIAWSLYNVFAIIVSILVCIERPRKRIAERIVMEEPISIGMDGVANCKLVDISETGAKMECDQVGEEEQKADVIHFTSESLGDMDGNVVWEKKTHHKKIIGIVFTQHSFNTYRKLLNLMSDKNKGYHDNRKK